MASSASQYWPSTTLPEFRSLPAPVCWWSSSHCTLSEAKYSSPSQTDDVITEPMHCITMPTNLMCFFKEPDWSDPISGQDLFCVIGNSFVTVCVYECVLVCLRLWICVSKCPCLHLFISAPPFSHWQLACLHFSHSSLALTESLPHKHRTTSHHYCLCCVQQHTAQNGMEAAKINTASCGCWGGFKDCKLLPLYLLFESHRLEM